MEIYVKCASINFRCENDGKAIAVRLGKAKIWLVKEWKTDGKFISTIIRKFFFTRFVVNHIHFFIARLLRGSKESGCCLNYCRLKWLRKKFHAKKRRKFMKESSKCVQNLTWTYCWFLNHSTKFENVNYFRIQIVKLNCVE